MDATGMKKRYKKVKTVLGEKGWYEIHKNDTWAEEMVQKRIEGDRDGKNGTEVGGMIQEQKK